MGSFSKFQKKLDNAKKKQAMKELTDDLTWAVTMALMLISASDGEIEKSELDVLAGALLGLDPNLTRAKVDEVMEETYTFFDDNEIEDCIDAIADRVPNQEVGKFVVALSALAMFADGQADRNEAEVYYSIADALGFEEEDADAIADEILEG
jgi:tellurite resistance protein